MATQKKVTVTQFNKLKERVPSKLRMRVKRLEKRNRQLTQKLNDLAVWFAITHPAVE